MNVLIIDDQPDVVAGIHSGINWDALSIRQVFCANDIIRAREILSNNSVDIMLCDIEMPLGSGLELYEWVAEHFPEIKCIFLTSHEDFSYAQKALQLGGFDYLIQPAPCKFKRKERKNFTVNMETISANAKWIFLMCF